ncbi:MAG TPA: hypothetical protein VFZ36_09110 [Vicinamibacterales bacterium]
MIAPLIIGAAVVLAPALASLPAQAPRAVDAAVPAVEAGSIAGVSIGATRDEVSALLAPRGSVAGREARDGGRRDVWTLAGGDYASVAVTTDARGRVTWVTGFVRPGHERPFSAFGDLERAVASGTRAVWDVQTSQGSYRLILRGNDARAQVVTMLAGR